MVWSTNLSGTPGDEEIDPSDKVQTVVRAKSPHTVKPKKISPTKKYEKIGSPDSKLGHEDVTHTSNVRGDDLAGTGQ